MTLVFLKLGGSLITDKRAVASARTQVIERLAGETAVALAQRPDMQLVLGHGSGSFGHVVARAHRTREGVQTPAGWRGFAETARIAARLNRLVADIFAAAGVPVWSLSPSASAWCHDGELIEMAGRPVSTALEHGLVPLVHGDVALDAVRGGTIVSTEEVFAWLAQRLQPQVILLAGIVDGVYEHDPLLDPRARHVTELTTHEVNNLAGGLSGSYATDVTGGMASKVRAMARLVEELPGLTVRFFSGEQTGALQRVLVDPAAAVGTRLRL
jgi:isopentenyl phosphate kinase